MKMAAAALVLAAGCLAADRQPPPWEKSRNLGQDLYREHCVVCHDIDGKKTKKPGPSLHRLFKNEKLPLSGGNPSREYIRVKIQFGGQLMPPFVKRMTDAEINTVINYLESR